MILKQASELTKRNINFNGKNIIEKLVFKTVPRAPPTGSPYKWIDSF
jgi:hypothetical protein